MAGKKNKRFAITSHKDQTYSEESVQHGSHGEEHRPRNLGVLDSLFHLDADWGTSLAYILPLSLTLAGRLAPVYMLIIAFIMFVVANGYKIVCRHNPDGGGVYSSLRKVNKFLAVVGALLLITDYIVTQALSITDAFHYLQLEKVVSAPFAPTIWTIAILIVLTVINWRGPHFSAKFAGIASSSTFVLAGLLGFLALPLVPAGLANIGSFNQSIFDVLRNTTGVLLALSGVEAISNMTGIMKDPEKTSRRAINLELLKVIFTTVVLGIAMNGMPKNVTYVSHVEAGKVVYETEVKEKTDLICYANKAISFVTQKPYECEKVVDQKARPDMLVAMGEYLVPGQLGKIYGALIGLAFGLLLIFAGNTALIDITNVTYALARDNELPLFYTKLNKKYGVPIWGLVTAGVAPILTVLLVGANVEALAALYAIGVVGAVTMNLAGTTLQVTGKERFIAGFGAGMMGILFVTLVFNKMEATLFAAAVLGIGLTARYLQKRFMKKRLIKVDAQLQTKNLKDIAQGQIFVPVFNEYDESLFEFAGQYAQNANKDVVLLYIRELDTTFPMTYENLKDDPEAETFVQEAHAVLKRYNKEVHVMYEFSDNIANSIIRYRQRIKPDTTILSPHQNSKLIGFLQSGTVNKILRYKNGKVIIYTGSDKIN